MQTFFDNQLYTLGHGLSGRDQRAYDRRNGEFADALAEFWSQRSSRTLGLRRWLNARRNIHANVAFSRHSLADERNGR